MERLVWILIMCLCGCMVSGFGLYAMKRQKPIWFWCEPEIKSEELRDVAAYNRENGIMWLVYSVVFWLSAFAVDSAALSLLAIAAIGAGCIALFPIYQKIYRKYSVKS